MVFISFRQGEDTSGRTTAVDLSAAARRQQPAQGAGGIWGEGSSRSAAWSQAHTRLSFLEAKISSWPSGEGTQGSYWKRKQARC